VGPAAADKVTQVEVNPSGLDLGSGASGVLLWFHLRDAKVVAARAFLAKDSTPVDIWKTGTGNSGHRK
jgi:hypothetical protein